VNVGCVPKKLMVYGSHYAQERRDSAGFGWGGIDEAKVTHSWKTLMDNKNKEITRLNGIYGKMLGNAGVDMIIGKGFIKPDGHTVTVATADGGSREISAETILVCTGGWPFKPTVPGSELGITSNEAVSD
jgi:glutathione reductase (NADPH)